MQNLKSQLNNKRKQHSFQLPFIPFPSIISSVHLQNYVLCIRTWRIRFFTNNKVSGIFLFGGRKLTWVGSLCLEAISLNKTEVTALVA